MREVFRGEISEGMGARASDLVKWYPWLSPGTVSALVKTGMGPQAPMAREVAQLEYERRKQHDDWMEPGVLLQKGGFPTTAELFGEVTSGTETQKGQEEGTDFGAVGEKPVGPEVAPPGGAELG